MSLSPSAPSFWKRPRVLLTLYGLLISSTQLSAALSVFSQSSIPNSGILFGLSLPWLILCGVSSLIGLSFAGLAIKAWRNPTWAGATWETLFAQGRWASWIRWGAALLFALTSILVFTPSYRFRFEAYFIRLYPFIAWLAFFSGLTFLISLLAKFEFQPANAKQAFRSRSQALLIALGVFLIGIILWGAYTWISLSTHYEEYSYGAGVPVLGSQILLALTAAMVFHYFERRGFLLRFKRADLWIGLVLWIVAALLWVRQPITPSYFNPGPYPPNQEYYPFSDASLFDMGSQSLLIGEGLYFRIPYERPFYMQFLVFLHLAVGQNYSDAMALQAALFAILAVFLYLIGKELAGRPLGIGLGILIALRGLNSIVGASIIDLSSPKQMLTDFPAAVGLALLTYLTVKWIKRPAENRLFVFWAGGVIGLLSLIRTNALLMIFPIALLVFVVYRHKLRAAFGLTFILFAMMLVSIYPWGVSNNQSMLEVYLGKFRTVLEQRYHFNFSQPDTLDPGSSAIHAAPIQFQAEAITPPAAKSPGVGFVVQGLYNNLLTSFLSLPASPQLHDLRYAVKVAFPFWNTRWDGSFTPPQTFFLLLQFILFSFGVGMAWKRSGLAGLTPLLLFFTYQLSNTLGRTSGGRYIVPVDWVVLVYYLLGFVEVLYFVLAAFSKPAPSEESAQPFPSDHFSWAASYNLKMAGILALFILIGLTPTLTGAMFFPRYTEERKAADLARLQTDGYFQAAGISPEQLKTFLDEPDATLTYGRAIYPRLYRAEKGERDSAYPYLTLPYPRLAFKLLNESGNMSVLFPTAKIPYFPNASDTMVLGCLVNSPNAKLAHIEALVIFLVGENGEAAVYTRHPVAPLQCPAPPIICKGKQCRSGD